ncbi:MAG: hypothetical protein ABIX01_12170 [Chitinophagaceae bacterium]
MKLLQLSAIVFFSSLSLPGHAQAPILFSENKWEIQAQSSLQEFYKGFHCLYLQNGQAWLKKEQFTNGIIEFDISMTERTSFSGVIFRMVDTENFEELYFRSQLSGMPDSYQYAPVYNGNSSWQLYHDQYTGVNDGFIHWSAIGQGMGYNAPLNFVFDEWMHVKLVVKGSQAELYLRNSPEPVAFMKELKRRPQGGSIGVKSAVGATRFANFSFLPLDNPVLKGNGAFSITTPTGTVESWKLSSFFKESAISANGAPDVKLLSGLSWKTMLAERSGLVNISVLGPIKDSANTSFAKLVVVSTTDQVKKMDIGYSDAIRVYCNGQLLFAGTNAFRTRDYKYLGTIGYFDALYLPLKKGENTILLAISEGFGGWGLMGKWENTDGIRMQE